MAVVLKWDGKQLPDELRRLPEGRYVIEAVDEPPALTDEEEAELDAALASVRAGQSIRYQEARASIDRILGR